MRDFHQSISLAHSKRLLPIIVSVACFVWAINAAAQTPSLAEQIFQKHQTILLSDEVQAVLPEVILELKKPENQALLTPAIIEAVLNQPDLLIVIDPDIDDEFITLLKQEDSDLRILLSDPDVQTLLQMPDAIDELVGLLEAEKPSFAIQISERYALLFQREDIRELLPNVFRTLNAPDTRPLLQPTTIKAVAETPDLLKIIVPEIDDKFISLLKEDTEVNALINDPDFHALLQHPDGIDELAALLDIDTAAIIRIVPASMASPKIEEQFAIAVTIDNAYNVRGYRLSVQFDPEALRYVSWQQGPYLSGDILAVSPTIESDQVSFLVTAPTKAESTQGVLLTITFEVVATKASTLSLSEVILVDLDGMALPVKTAGSEIEAISIIPEEVPSPEETEDDEMVEPTPMETEDSEVTEPMPDETEDNETVEPTPMETEDSEVTEPMPDETEDSEIIKSSTPAWDVNEDRVINVLDLLLVAADIGQEGPIITDVNGDNVVNILDLRLVANHLGEEYE